MLIAGVAIGIIAFGDACQLAYQKSGTKQKPSDAAPKPSEVAAKQTEAAAAAAAAV